MALRDLLSADHFPRRLRVAGRKDVESLRAAVDAGSHFEGQGALEVVNTRKKGG